MAYQKHSWLITGASSGLGQALALAVLQAGHAVVGTSRSAPSPDNQFNRSFVELGGKWLKLDVTDPNTTEIVSRTIAQEQIDVIVNSAGYAQLGAIEDVNDAEIHAQMDTNFYGALRVIRAALPSFRDNKKGVIVNISSGAGLTGRPGRGIYSTSKFALESASEGLAAELKPFGIRILLVEPGGFKTPISSSCKIPADHTSTGGLRPAYHGSDAEKFMQVIKDEEAASRALRGDPKLAADAIIHAVMQTGPLSHFNGLRLPLGNDCIAAYEEKLESLRSDLEATRAVAASTDFKG